MLHSTISKCTFASMNLENTQAQMRRGILELCILGIIHAEGEAYPSDIIERMKDARLIVVEGTLYPMLSRLKNGGLLDYHWVESKSGPPRKYYKLTELGSRYFEALKETWADMHISVSQVLKPKPNE